MANPVPPAMDAGKIDTPPPPPPPALSADSYAPIPGEEATVTAGKDYGTQSTIQDTDKRNGKARSLFNIPAARA